MSVNTFKYIHFAHYKDIPNWSVQYVVEEKLGFTKKYPMAKICSFLKKSKDQIEIQDDAEYKQVTVKINNGGVIARNDGQLKRGSEIGTKRQTVVHAGHPSIQHQINMQRTDYLVNQWFMLLFKMLRKH